MSSTTNTLVKKYSAKSFFRFNFRQNIQHLALYLVVAVLVMVLPTIMMIENYYDNERTVEYSDYLVEEAVQTIGVIGLFVSGGIALLSGMSSLAYVNSKQNVGCYHSFPIKRETMYLTDSLTRAIYYAITMLFGYILPFVIFLAAFPSAAVIKYSGDYFKFILAGVIAFLLIYSAFLLAAGLTGTALMRFFMVIAIFFLPLAIYAAFFASFSMANSKIYDSYYWNEDLIQYICTPVRAVVGVDEMLNSDKFLKLLMLIPEAAVYYIGGLFLHKFRKSESTGTTVIWKPVFMFIKYVVIILCTLLGAYIFYNIEDTGVSFFIGAVIGAVLSLILMNCLLYRSSRAMFKGLKPFSVCCACAVLFMIFVPLNVTGKVGEFYSAGNTREITIEISNTGIELDFDDKEDIEAIMAMLDDDEAMYSGDEYLGMPVLDPEKNEIYYELDDDRTLACYIEEYGYTPEDIESIKASVGKNTYGVETYSMTVVQKPKFGIPLAVRATSDASSEFTDTIFATEEFAEIMNLSEWLEDEYIGEIYVNLDSRYLDFYDGTDCYYRENNMSYNYSYKDAWETALEIVDLCKYDHEGAANSAIVGQVTIYYREKGSTNAINYPIYADNLELINTVSEVMAAARNDYRNEDIAWQPYKSALEYFEAAEELMDDNRLILLVDCATGETVELTPKEFAELGQYTVSYLAEDEWGIRQFTRYSTSRYAILYQRDNERDIEIRFRKDAISDEELAEYFAE